MLDEPYSGLDSDGAAVLDRELAERTAAVLLATHDPTRVDSWATAHLALA